MQARGVLLLCFEPSIFLNSCPLRAYKLGTFTLAFKPLSEAACLCDKSAASSFPTPIFQNIPSATFCRPYGFPGGGSAAAVVQVTAPAGSCLGSS